ncbi:putative COMM domain-containing protein [Rosa chinensis]|uniref:Putative COMM domain-containing protein n=1 Tax=Rosa chinensis TaxID=74649 RepID=A0A2P6SD46_ROSCH|nr:putative COMM domain-containing protein [Rosa chinensis]
MTPLLWPRQDEVMRRFNLNDAGAPAQTVSDLNLPRMAPFPFYGMMVLLRICHAPGNRVAVINLKLQDYSRTPSAESEVKFQLSRVSLEPMLRSMAYISDQLSTPANKVAVINLKLQDTETTTGESEVKFQVSRDTLGAMLRSMAYIREQLSTAGEVHSDSQPKKQRK